VDGAVQGNLDGNARPPLVVRGSGSFFRENASYSAARIGDITTVTWDQMHVHVHSILSGGSPDIDADVVAVRRMICRNLLCARSRSDCISAFSSAVMSK
jgi:hypothetical protein